MGDCPRLANPGSYARAPSWQSLPTKARSNVNARRDAPPTRWIEHTGAPAAALATAIAAGARCQTIQRRW